MTSEEPENLTLRYSRRLEERIDRMVDHVRGLKGCVGALEEALHRPTRRMDAFDDRLFRIERRLDLVDDPLPR